MLDPIEVKSGINRDVVLKTTYGAIQDIIARAEAAEARAADLAESNREQAEAITTLSAERDEQATRIIELEATAAAYKIGNDELKRIIDTLRIERNEAWSSLKEARDTIQDLTL